jgi:adenylate cyclase
VAGVVTSGVLDVEPDTLDGETITILFSDIESSTERATAMGDAAWFELLEVHNAIIRTAVARFGGREVKSIGDGFMLVFPSVRRALRFATAVQQQVEAPDGPDLRIRMGIHTGETIIDASGDLFGRHVNLAARVANLAAGGEIMASLVVLEIAAGRDDAIFGEPSQTELKGFAELQTVYQVHWSEDAAR